MKREIQITADGSTSIFIPELNEGYHSKHGAIQEAYHVFIKNGLEQCKNKEISILEIGFGTGLNAFITYLETEKNNQKINYIGIEAYPVLNEHILQMNYVEQLNELHNQTIFTQMHTANWEQPIALSSNFKLTKRNQFFQDITDQNTYNLIYFDAFGFTAQPELWTEAIFKIMYNALQKDGILVTYACRTSIKKAMITAGFTIEKLPGAPGKREMLRATKK
jgi:tRNA U34 5-methylaminomethyl-2-thiouridine-forming methyltransferase MnmC